MSIAIAIKPATARSRRSGRTRKPATPSIPLPRTSDGWTPECVTLVIRAYDDRFGGMYPGYVESYSGPVPELAVDNLLMGASILSVERADLTLASILVVLREAQRFTGIE